MALFTLWTILWPLQCVLWLPAEAICWNKKRKIKKTFFVLLYLVPLYEKTQSRFSSVSGCKCHSFTSGEQGIEVHTRTVLSSQVSSSLETEKANIKLLLSATGATLSQRNRCVFACHNCKNRGESNSIPYYLIST